MKTKLHLHILLLVCIATFTVVCPAVGQEAGIPDFEFNDPDKDRAERDRIINSPGEGDTRYSPPKNTNPNNTGTSTVTNDSAVTKAPTPPPPAAKTHQPVKPAEKQSQPKAEDESVLSFNFLYYIIQKYKLQDIID